MNGSSSSARRARHPVTEPSEQRSWHTEVLEVCRSLAGLPTLAVLVTGVFCQDQKITAAIGAVALAIAATLRFLPADKIFLRLQDRQFLLTTLPWVLSGLMAALTVLAIIPGQARPQTVQLRNFLSQSNQWIRDLDKAANHCSMVNEITSKKLNVDRLELSKCLANRLSKVLEQRPKPEDSNEASLLASDMLAGQAMLANQKIAYILDKRLGIRSAFMGTGASSPSNQIANRDVHVPEYLVPNLNEKAPNVWVWQLDHDALFNQGNIEEGNLLEVLQHFPTSNPNHDFAQRWDYLNNHLSANDKRPVLVRFAVFNGKG